MDTAVPLSRDVLPLRQLLRVDLCLESKQKAAELCVRAKVDPGVAMAPLLSTRNDKSVKFKAEHKKTLLTLIKWCAA